MGAMENKSLNVFNTSLTLAREDTATDDDYERIEGVIGHEYFHNWTWVYCFMEGTFCFDYFFVLFFRVGGFSAFYAVPL